MKKSTALYFLPFILLLILSCASRNKITRYDSLAIDGKAQEMRERLKQIEAHEHTSEIYVDSVSSIFCEYLQYIDFTLLEKTIVGISTDQVMYRYETDTTQVTWGHHRLGSMIRSLSSFTTKGERYSHHIINIIDDKTQLKCPGQYTRYLKTQGTFDEKIRELEVNRVNRK